MSPTITTPRDDAGGDDSRHGGLHVARAGARARRWTSARTSGRLVPCSSRCSRAAARSPARTSPTRSSAVVMQRNRTGARCRRDAGGSAAIAAPLSGEGRQARGCGTSATRAFRSRNCSAVRRTRRRAPASPRSARACRARRGTRAAVDVGRLDARARDRVGAGVGAVARGRRRWIVRWCGWTSIWARMFPCPPPAPGEQRRHLPRWHAAGIRVGHAHEALHAAAGSTESH